jgi:hypothetical protein
MHSGDGVESKDDAKYEQCLKEMLGVEGEGLAN